MFDDDELTRPKKRRSKLTGNSESLFEQMENSSLDGGKFTKKFADNVIGPKRGRPQIEGGSRGPIAKQMGRGSIQSADFMGNVKWTPAKKIITFLLTGGSYAGIFVAIYLSGLKAVAIAFGGGIMFLFLIFYILHWMFNG